jgi:hypothetical protein
MTDHPNRVANLLNVTSTPMAGWLRYRLFEPPGARASVPRLWVSLRARRPLWDPLATVLVAVAVAIVVGSGQHSLLRPKGNCCPYRSLEISMRR